MKSVLALGVLLCGGVAHAGEAASVPPLDQAVEQAKVAGRPLFIEFYTTWCKPCKVFEAEVLPKPEVQEALREVMFVRYDAEDGAGIAAAARLNVSGFPTFVAVDETGAARLREVGAPTEPRRFVELVARAADVTLSEQAMGKRIAAAPRDARVLLRAGRWHESRERRVEAIGLYRRAARADSGNRLGVAAQAEWRALELGLAQDARARVQQAAVSYVRRYPGAEQAGLAFRVAVLSGGLSGPALADLARRRLAAVRAEPEALNDLAYLLLGAGEREVALAAARRQVELRPTEANPYDTLAEVHHYRGERELALAASDQAVAKSAETPNGPAYATNRERFARGGAEPSPDVLREQRAAHDLIAALLVPEDNQAGDDSPMPPEQQAVYAFMTGTRKAFERVGTYCARHAGSLEEAYVRLELAPTGGHPVKVTVLEPDASPALAACIARRFAIEELAPPPPGGLLDRYTQSLHFPRK